MNKEDKSTQTNLTSEASPYENIPLGLKRRRMLQVTAASMLFIFIGFGYFSFIRYIKNIDVDVSGVAPIPVDLGKAIYGGDFLTQGYEDLRFLSIDIESPQWNDELDSEFTLSASPLDDNGDPIPGAQSTQIAVSVNGDPYIMGALEAQYYGISVVSAPLAASSYSYPSYSIVQINTGMNYLTIELDNATNSLSPTSPSFYKK